MGKNAYQLLKPSSIILFFTVSNFALGNFAFWKGYFLVGHVSNFERIFQFKHVGEANIYIFFTLWLIYAYSFRGNDGISPTKRLKIGNKLLVFPLLIVLAISWRMDLEGNVFKILNIALTLSLLLNISKYRVLRWRVLLYVVVIVSYALISYDDKRNVLLAILTVFLLELDFSSLFRWKSVLLIVLVLSGFLGLLSVLTIFRGYDGFDVEHNLLELPKYVNSFYSNDAVISWMLHTTESYTTYFHTLQSIEFAIESGSYLYGSTIFKALFVPLPSSLIEKPWSIIDHYTFNLYPQFRLLKGALAPNAIGEFYFNFGFYGSFFYLILAAIFDKLYALLLKNGIYKELGFWFYIYFLFYIRGSGLDLYLAYVYTSMIFVLLHMLMNKRFLNAWNTHS